MSNKDVGGDDFETIKFNVENTVDGEQGEEVQLEFIQSPFDAINEVYSYMNEVPPLEGEEHRAKLLRAYVQANLALGDGIRRPTTDNEIMLMCAFWEMGYHFGKSMVLHPEWNTIQENTVNFLLDSLTEKENRHSKGGKHSVYKPFESNIKKYLKKYSEDRGFTQQKACDAIAEETGLTIAQNTFSYWWKKYKNNEDIFQE